MPLPQRPSRRYRPFVQFPHHHTRRLGSGRRTDRGFKSHRLHHLSRHRLRTPRTGSGQGLSLLVEEGLWRRGTHSDLSSLRNPPHSVFSGCVVPVISASPLASSSTPTLSTRRTPTIRPVYHRTILLGFVPERSVSEIAKPSRFVTSSPSRLRPDLTSVHQISRAARMFDSPAVRLRATQLARGEESSTASISITHQFSRKKPLTDEEEVQADEEAHVSSPLSLQSNHPISDITCKGTHRSRDGARSVRSLPRSFAEGDAPDAQYPQTKQR